MADKEVLYISLYKSLHSFQLLGYVQFLTSWMPAFLQTNDGAEHKAESTQVMEESLRFSFYKRMNTSRPFPILPQ